MAYTPLPRENRYSYMHSNVCAALQFAWHPFFFHFYMHPPPLLLSLSPFLSLFCHLLHFFCNFLYENHCLRAFRNNILIFFLSWRKIKVATMTTCSLHTWDIPFVYANRTKKSFDIQHEAKWMEINTYFFHVDIMMMMGGESRHWMWRLDAQHQLFCFIFLSNFIAFKSIIFV